ncbi:MAG: hypothetical protein PVJ64_07050 [Gemmatimonadales bacterium]|jgi:hypothetical protein
MKRTGSWVVLFVSFVLGTGLLGWWTVPVVAGVWGGVKAYDRRPWWSAAIAVTAAWSLLLAISGTRGPLLALARTLGGIFGLPGFAVVLLALIFPAILAWSAAGLVSALLVTLRERARASEPA